MPALKIVYIVHDLNDAAIARRLDMFRRSGASVALLGFHRGAAPSAKSGVTDLGHTRNGRMFARLRAVATAALREPEWGKSADGADMILARNLECLALAALAQRRRAPCAALVYECLDIHRLMLGAGLTGRALRWLEAWLLRVCDGLLISSPGFLDHYFQPRHAALPHTVLVENKLLAAEAPTQAPLPCANGPPWRIGWLGIIRCRRSLELLQGLVRALPGLVDVQIRGRPARDVLPDFDAIVAETPGLSFHGPYDRKRDLSTLYAGVHFTWTLDFYEAGGNSDWLLPNRLYEGAAHGPVALANANSQTGQWLKTHDAGVRLEEPLSAGLLELFATLTADLYAGYFSAMQKIPRNCLVYDDETCNLKMRELIGTRKARAQPHV